MPARFLLVNLSGYVNFSTLGWEKVFGTGKVYVIRGAGGAPVVSD
jgi:hypothetical protein